MHSTVSGVSTYVRLDDDGFHQLVFGRLLVRLRPTAMQVTLPLLHCYTFPKGVLNFTFVLTKESDLNCTEASTP